MKREAVTHMTLESTKAKGGKKEGTLCDIHFFFILHLREALILARQRGADSYRPPPPHARTHHIARAVPLYIRRWRIGDGRVLR